ncbi:MULTISPECIES: peptidoglycan DD-metalloendopeptidase family protein [unclassified Thioalkalivibrio]|uniref:peptidoglycan DD-metalloendopeptidase family protein n=1 Tax=unclassified Thioalkalivibrio TaxID=2621013 RepID=UPI000368B47B|nr:MULTISPECIES: peptidoglycan DD-metalloendopeptidase family protein [unclassified Thioalkalivibrio]
MLVAIAGLVVALVSGCATRAPSGSSDTSRASGPVPATHTVQREETLYRIAHRYGLDWREVAQRNAISAPYIIYPGQELRLRGAARSSPPQAPRQQRQESSTASSSDGDSGASREAARSDPPPDDPGGWRWPADGDVLRGFSSSGTRRGLAIGGERGDEVRATRSGEVVYAGGGLVGYGRLIILKHNARFLSAYGHNDELLVSEGDQVEAGETIARLGSSGAERPMLHFEIRVDGTPVDPTRYLPDR